jgi:hypothetical protein
VHHWPSHVARRTLAPVFAQRTAEGTPPPWLVAARRGTRDPPRYSVARRSSATAAATARRVWG